MKKITKDGWAVICSKGGGMRAFTIKENATKHRDFLNDEYKKCCRHKVVKCKIIYEN